MAFKGYSPMTHGALGCCPPSALKRFVAPQRWGGFLFTIPSTPNPFQPIEKKRANKQTKGLFSARQKWTFASVSLTHAKSILKVTSCLHWVNLLCRNNGRYQSVRSIMFSPLRLRSAINIMPPFISVHQATVRCRKLHGGRMSCWFNVWAPVSKVDHSCWAHSHLLSVSRRLPCIFKKPLQWERHTYSF